uniref:Uncharacterized protein At5g39570 n=1 Tax=Anthurium amnicola TaxID=1678845 RepID=A0A1D1XPG4_9ARAE
MASPPSGFNEEESFDEYNPHPHQGGYDIDLTYGRALPPSSAICYPISSPKAEPLAALGEERLEDSPYIPSYGHRGESDQLSPRDAGEYGHSSDSVEEDYYPRGYGAEEFRGPGHDYWPFPAQESDGGHEGGISWDQDPWRCAADYLFGYLHVYGEKRDERHTCGNLNYAYERHQPQEPLLIQFSPHEPSWHERPSYHEDHQGEVYPASGYGYSYVRDTAEVPYSEIVCVGSSWSPTSYHEDYSEQVYPQSDCSHAYERHHYEQPLFVQHEQTEHTYGNELCESHVHLQEADLQTYGNKCYEEPPDELNFIEKSWYQLVNNTEFGEVNSYPQVKTNLC